MYILVYLGLVRTVNKRGEFYLRNNDFLISMFLVGEGFTFLAFKVLSLILKGEILTMDCLISECQMIEWIKFINGAVNIIDSFQT